MEHNKQQQQKTKRGKTQYNKHTKFICAEYVLLDTNERIVADFQTAKEAHNYKQKNPQTTIYILKTFKLN